MDAPPTPADVMAFAFRQASDAGLFDAWLTAWAWRRASADAPVEDLAALYATLHEHARASAALQRRAFRAAPARDPAWASKAGPRPC